MRPAVKVGTVHAHSKSAARARGYARWSKSEVLHTRLSEPGPLQGIQETTGPDADNHNQVTPHLEQ